MTEEYFQYWGKASDESYHLLPYHLLDVAAVGRQLLLQDKRLLEKITPMGSEPESIINIVTFFLALHDIGKFSERFQNLYPDILESLQGKKINLGYSTYHTEMGRVLFDEEMWEGIKKRLNLMGDSRDWKDVWNPWLFAITGHHGSPPEKSGYTCSILFAKEDVRAASSFIDACEFLLPRRLEPQIYNDEYLSSFGRKSWLLAGLVILSDWIGSDNAHFPHISTSMPLETYWRRYAVPQAEKAIRDFGLLPGTISTETGMHVLFPLSDRS